MKNKIIEEIDKKKFAFKEYNPLYLKYFKKEKDRLATIAPFFKAIEHVGSTSVPGLGGKEVVDILIVAEKKDMARAKNKLLQAGYTSMRGDASWGRISFRKYYGILFWKRLVHIHLTYPNSKTFKTCINFRDNLRKNSKLAMQYEKIKKEAVKYAGGHGPSYREYKNKFIAIHSR